MNHLDEMKTLLVTAAVGGLLVMTKPGIASFKSMVHQLFKKARHQAIAPSSLTNILFGGAVSKAMDAMVQREVEDYVLWTVGTWKTDAHWATYVGALNTWWCINSDVEEQLTRTT